MSRKREVTFILAGGDGTRLAPLTHWRAKPALPFGGDGCLLDVTLRNCLNSGLSTAHVLVQRHADSIRERVEKRWLNSPSRLKVVLRPPPSPSRPYLGTADAVRQNLNLIPRSFRGDVLVLSGDHVYEMDYRRFLEFHRTSGARASVAVTEVPVEEASRFGVVVSDEHGKVLGFWEKPAEPELLPTRGRSFVHASMGVYVFDAELLRYLLSDPSVTDFGRDLLPRLSREGSLFAYPFVDSAGRSRYWRDVGTVDAYYEAHMDLVSAGLGNVFQERSGYLSDTTGISGIPAVVPSGVVPSVPQAVVEGDVTKSVLSSEVRIERGARVEDSVLLEGVVVECGAFVRRAILDRGVRVRAGSVLDGSSRDAPPGTHRTPNGIVVVPAGRVVGAPSESFVGAAAERSGALSAVSSFARPV